MTTKGNDDEQPPRHVQQPPKRPPPYLDTSHYPKGWRRRQITMETAEARDATSLVRYLFFPSFFFTHTTIGLHIAYKSPNNGIYAPTGMFLWYVLFYFVFYCTNFFLQNLRGLGPNNGIKAQDDPWSNFAMSTALTTTAQDASIHTLVLTSFNERLVFNVLVHWFGSRVCYPFIGYFILVLLRTINLH